jgi:hypothetical protein
MTVFPALGRLRYEDCECEAREPSYRASFKASLSYT